MTSELNRLRRHAALASRYHGPTALGRGAVAPRSRRKVAAWFWTASLCVSGLAAGITTAVAGDHVSRWDGDATSAARLLAGSATAGSAVALRAGLEFRLKSGWHTYWRY